MTLKGVNLTAGRIIPGEIKFHVANEAEFGVVMASP